VPSGRVARAGRIGDRAREQCPCCDLRVEGLGGSDAHLHVASVRGVEHPVGLVGEVAAAPIHDADHCGTAGAQEVDGAVGVGRGPRLADRDGEGVAHVEAHVETGQLGGRDGVDVEAAAGQLGEDRRSGLAGDGGGALADDADPGDEPVAEAVPHVGRDGRGTESGMQFAVVVADLSPQCLGEAGRSLGDLLEEEVRCVTAVDVASGHLGGDHLVEGDRDRRSVVAQAFDLERVTGTGGVEDHDLAALLAVHPHIPGRLLDHPVRLAGDDPAVVAEADEEALPAAAERHHQRGGGVDRHRTDRHRALELGDRAAERVDCADSVGEALRHDRRNHLGVRGDLARNLQAVLGPQVGVVVDIAVECSHHVGRRLGAGGLLHLE